MNESKQISVWVTPESQEYLRWRADLCTAIFGVKVSQSAIVKSILEQRMKKDAEYQAYLVKHKKR